MPFDPLRPLFPASGGNPEIKPTDEDVVHALVEIQKASTTPQPSADSPIHVASLFPMYDEEVPLFEKMGVQQFWNAPNFDPYNPRRAHIAPVQP